MRDVSTEVVTAEKIAEILKKIENDPEVKILEFFSGPITEKGENWSSTLVRVDFTALVGQEKKTYHWVGKFLPASPERKIFHNAAKLGEKEARVYSEFLPQLQNFIQERGLENEIYLNFPPCPYAALDDEEFYFFMENMKELGYSDEFDKKQGLDLDHCKVALDELAKFHATSHAYIMKQAEGSSLEQILDEMELITKDFVYTQPTKEFEDFANMFAEQGREGLLRNINALANEGEDLVGPLLRFFEKESTRSQFNFEARRFDIKKFNVIIHNDAWFNNMIFKYETESGRAVPKRVSLVDIALYCWNSPVVDLSYFFFMSLEPEMRQKNQDLLLEYYHGKLTHYLEGFGIDPSVYTLSELKKEYDAKVIIGVISSTMSLPAVLLPSDKAMDQSDLDWSDPAKMMDKAYAFFYKALQEHPEIRERMRGNYLEGIRKGALQ